MRPTTTQPADAAAQPDEPPVETTDRSIVEAMPDDTLPLGVDGEDAVHHFSRRADLVVVEAPSGRIERREHLTSQTRTLASWIAYVDDKRGWRTLNYADTFEDVLREALT